MIVLLNMIKLKYTFIFKVLTLTKPVKDLYDKNFKFLKKEIEEDPR